MKKWTDVLWWWLGVALMVFGLGFVTTAEGALMTIWSDGFEGTSFTPPIIPNGNWATQQTALSAYAGSRGANVQGPTTALGDVLAVPISTAGYNQIAISGVIKIRDDLEAGDVLRLDFDWNGSGWLNVTSWSGPLGVSDWQSFNQPLSLLATDNKNFRFRFVLVANGTTDRVNLDELVLSGEPVPEPVGLPVLVLGVIAFLKHRRPLTR